MVRNLCDKIGAKNRERQRERKLKELDFASVPCAVMCGMDRIQGPLRFITLKFFG